MRVWIETSKLLVVELISCVTLFVRVWIETNILCEPVHQ